MTKKKRDEDQVPDLKVSTIHRLRDEISPETGRLVIRLTKEVEKERRTKVKGRSRGKSRKSKR